MNAIVYRRHSRQAFTLIEIMVAVAVLALLVAMISQLLLSAMSVTTLGNKHMDADDQARTVFDRMAIDFAQIVKRPDVDYYLKDGTSGNTQTGNDQLAFYSQVPGYATSTTSQPSPVSLVAYRVNSSATSPYYNQLERLGYGLAWNGALSTDNPVVFSSNPTSSLPNTISANWPNATTSASDAAHEELVGPEVFRMEYYYVLRGQTTTSGTFTSNLTSSTQASQLSATPWYTSATAPFTAHTSVNGLQDVAAVTMVIAVIDPRSRALVSNPQLISVAAQMNDFAGTMKPGDLENQWRTAVMQAVNTNTISKLAGSAIRIYRRDFYLPQINPNSWSPL